MSQAIHCPQCNKKYSLPANPPATFTCRQCQTLMDLSDFGGQDAPAAPAAPSGGAPKSRRTRAKGGGGGRRQAAPPPPSRGGGRRSRRGAPAGPSRGGRSRRGAREDDFDDGGRRAARARKENNNAVIIGAAVALVVVVALAIIILGSKDEEPTGTQDTAKVGEKKKDAPSALTGIGGGDDTSAAPTGDAPKADTPKGDAPSGGTPAKSDTPKGDAPKPAEAKKKKRLRNTSIKSMRLEIHDWPDEVDAETRKQVDEAVQALYGAGREFEEAKEFLRTKGRVIAGRIISEFKRVDESPGFDRRDGASLAGVLDSVLRSIDGYQERRFKEENQIRATSRPSFILKIAKRWTAWWVSDEWKNNPRDPWDPFEDSFDEPEGKKKKKGEGSGFGKRAGG